MFDDDESAAHMSPSEIAIKLQNLVLEADEADLPPVSERQHRAIGDIIEKLNSNLFSTKPMNQDVARGALLGMYYGFAIITKVASREINTKKELVKRIKALALVFRAARQTVDKWPDDKWFDNLMATAIVAEPTKIKKPKKKQK